MATYKEGEFVFQEEVPGASREAIALFSVATEDPNPIHTDDAFAQACGFPQILQQGPMTTAHFARLLARELGAANLKSLDVVFTAPVFPEEPLQLVAKVTKVDVNLTLEISSHKRDGTLTAKGLAVVKAG